jgi:hypothetical protein
MQQPPPDRASAGPNAWAARWRLVRQHRWAFSLPALPLALGGWADLTYDWHVPHDFMQIAAQILPVLILALALETRVLSIREFDDPELRGIGIGIATLLGLGTLAPMTALLMRRDLLVLAAPTVLAIVLALGLILALAVLDPARFARVPAEADRIGRAAERVQQAAERHRRP